MIFFMSLVTSLAVAAGVYLALSRDLFRSIVGLAVLGSGANLVLFFAGRLGPMDPAIIPENEAALGFGAASPLPQALVLTAIVISFALLCFALVLGARLRQQGESADSDSWQAAEPPETDPVKPALMD